MVVGWLLHGLKHGSFRCRFEHCNPLKKPPAEKFNERRNYRKKLLGVWLNSVSDDLDMITDWWFFLRMYELHGIDIDGGTYARATLALLLFCILGSISYLLELYQTVFKYPATFAWLPAFTIFFEDVPQILLSLILSGALDVDPAELTPSAAFNISTSVYSALIKVSGEVFVNYFYCCKFVPPREEEEEESDDAAFVDAERASADSKKKGRSVKNK
mmetsp:Transcript_33572/g.81177  ORF Transcript_33572/g.81177 Transcript_33572/m.81177 type:complete len:216 (+) Transcript_33572:290-937(+)|eukprot:CAMPEP_0181103282 /NCGR_PEP_ID=MMETSP1071-20121207/14782_1 /TAXON_ID=35127 /ORGANISM="Thalassiosira sp., Strain NH16" /LENGTH=215 /DNA_ID=CAMNT_0023186345 /DNA_START=435 /DNA_END=1082 /DNA_ORIENTATION=+